MADLAPFGKYTIKMLAVAWLRSRRDRGASRAGAMGKNCGNAGVSRPFSRRRQAGELLELLEPPYKRLYVLVTSVTSDIVNDVHLELQHFNV